jgi:hypothetical protein
LLTPNGFMDIPHFAENPTGVEYDPDEWLSRLRAGDAAESFLRRTVRLPVSPVRGSATQV